MNIHQNMPKLQIFDNVIKTIFEYQRRSPALTVKEAISFDDFRQATQVMRRTSREKCSPLETGNLGALISRLNHGGSGPKAGTIILAQKEGRTIGFALLVVNSDTSLNLTWLHAEGECKEAPELLWQESLNTSRKWGYPILNIGAFVQLPQSVTSEKHLN